MFLNFRVVSVVAADGVFVSDSLYSRDFDTVGFRKLSFYIYPGGPFRFLQHFIFKLMQLHNYNELFC